MKKILMTVVLTTLLFVVLVGGGVLVGVNKYYNVKRLVTIGKVIWVKPDRSAWVYVQKSGDIMYTKGKVDGATSIFLSSDYKDIIVGKARTELTATMSDDKAFVKYSDGSSAMLSRHGVVILYKSPKGKILFNWKALDAHCWDELDKPFWKVDFLSPEAGLSKEGW